MAELMKQRRAELGLSQAQLAAAAGVDARQIRRYEAGEQHPALPVAKLIAQALGVTIGELAGEPSQRLDLVGDWYAGWESSQNGVQALRFQPIYIGPRKGEVLDIQAMARGDEVANGGYLWKGELRLWDNEILIGWYAANDGSVRSKGSLYFTIHPHGQSMFGRWVGLSHDGQTVTGWATVARTEDAAREAMDRLVTPA